MRPLVEAVLGKEGKYIVGPRWTAEQVYGAYEKADGLLDYIDEWKKFDSVQKLGLHKMHLGFKEGLKARLEKGMPDEALQVLSLSVLEQLLEKGKDTMKKVAWLYKFYPAFRMKYASSKQAFLKDKFFLNSVPIYSFSPFKTGDNPVTSRDVDVAQVTALLYTDPLFEGKEYLSYLSKGAENYTRWLNTKQGNKFLSEGVYLRDLGRMLSQQTLDYSVPHISKTTLQKHVNINNRKEKT